MPQRPLTVALLTHQGGAHVTAYLQALAEADHCGAVVVADSDGRFGQDARRILGDKLTALQRDPAAVLKEHQPEMALVTWEARGAPPVIDAALSAGCHVLAEKPACVRPDDFRRLVDKADQKHRHLMLALANRWNPETQAARALVESGQLGTLYGLEMHLVADQTRLTRPSYRQQWFAQKARAGGGHLIWLGIHWLDLAMYVTGSTIVEVAGFTANVGGQPIDVEDSAAAALRFDNGTLGTITSGYYLQRGYHSHLKVWGERGWLHLEPMKAEPLHWQLHHGPRAGEVQTFQEAKEPRGYSPFVAAAVNASADLNPPPVSNHDSLRALATVFAIYDASQRKATLPVSNSLQRPRSQPG